MKTEIVLRNELEELARLEAFVQEAGEREGLSPEVTGRLNLALEEAVVNVVDYAYGGEQGLIVVTAERRGGRLVFEVRDKGAAFDPTGVEEPDVTLPAEERRPGGLGLFLVRRLMDGVAYERVGDTNVLTLIKQIG